MDMHKPAPCSETDILRFHDPSYISFLKKITPDTMGDSGMERLMAKCVPWGSRPAVIFCDVLCVSFRSDFV